MFAYWLETVLALALIGALVVPIFSNDKGRRSFVLAVRSHEGQIYLSLRDLCAVLGLDLTA